MNSKSQITLLLTQANTNIGKFEQTIEKFEQAITQVEQLCGETARDETRASAGIASLAHALQACYEIADQARTTRDDLDDALIQAEMAVSANLPSETVAPLPPNTAICAGRYRLLRLLHRRPRVHLYLARRLTARNDDNQSLVVIREIVLSGLGQITRQNVVRAAFEEFAAPQLFGSAHLAGVGDHLYLEKDRHYLVMQPRQVRGTIPALAQPLTERLPGPTRPDMPTALRLGTRLCQTVAHLHRLRLYLGELTPAMILIDRTGNAAWAPLLLAAWPPAPSFWPGRHFSTTQLACQHLFPVLENDLPPTAQDEHAFVAPEVLTDHTEADARADVYALGTILYLLFTGNIPPAASQRLRASQNVRQHRGLRSRRHHSSAPQDTTLPSPHQFNAEISPLLEQILLRALALAPEQRFASARDLTEALESISLKNDLPATPALAPPFSRLRASRLRRLLQWLRR